MGAMINAPINEIGDASIAPISNYATFGVYQTNDLGKLGADFEWNITNWSTNNLRGSTIAGSYIQTNNLKVTPNLEFKLQKYFGITMGLYIGIKLDEIPKENLFFGTALSETETNVIQLFNFGYSLGSKIYFSKRVELKFNFIKGFMNVANSGVKSNSGNFSQSAILKNRVFQLGMEFNLSEFL